MASEFDRIYAETRERLRRFLSGTLSDAQDREECFQEAYLRLWQQCAKAAPENPGAWLVVVARRIAARLPPRPQTLPEDDEPALASRARKGAMALDEVREALGLLDPARRETFCLRHFGGLSYAEIARELEIPEGTVASRIHDSLEVLRRQLVGDLSVEKKR